MSQPDTIMAISTPAGYALRAVIRLSGPRALESVRRRFRPSDPRAPWDKTFHATSGTLLLEAEDLGVPVTVYVMLAPHSYTRDDVVELHVPGSPAVADMVLEEFMRDEIRLARPGEFTQRAFLSGRIDLAQAEAVLSVVRARNEAELLAASAKLEGRVSRECRALQEELTALRASVEAALDFAEHDIELIPEEQFIGRTEALAERIERELAKGHGELASDGHVRAVLCGPPNAGKSSLLNRLAGQEVALVHETPGVTRDPVSTHVEVQGISFTLTDTAGLQTGSTGLEAAATDRARRALKEAHLLVLVLDGTRSPRSEDLAIASGVEPGQVLCVVNKCDLPQAFDEEEVLRTRVAGEVVRTSALTGEGTGELRAALARVVMQGRLDASAADCLFNARQRQAVRRALRSLRRSQDAVRGGLGYEFAALDLGEASEALSEVTGHVGAQDVLDRIFSQFCIGK